MRKQFDGEPSEDRSSRTRRIPWAWLAGGGLVAPFLYELVLLWHARWMSMVGPTRDVPTPVLDRTFALARSAWAGLGAYFDRVPWSPNVVVAVGLGWAAGCMWLFRRR